jgi:hypothetical protein
MPAKTKKTKLKVVPVEKTYRYAVTRIPVHGEGYEFCDHDCQFMQQGIAVGPVCVLDPTSKVPLEQVKQEFKRHKVCLESSNFVHMNIMRAKMEKMLGA